MSVTLVVAPYESCPAGYKRDLVAEESFGMSVSKKAKRPGD